MDAEQFDKAINFHDEEDANGDKVITANFIVTRSIKIAQELVGSHRTEIVNHAKRILKNDLARDIYEDRRRELHEALRDFAIAEPFTNQFQHARSELVRVALRQPDATIDSMLETPNKTVVHQAEAWNRILCDLIFEYGLEHTEPGQVALEQARSFLRRKLK